MEFGPRALGSRSIIGDARSEKMQSVMNSKLPPIKVVKQKQAKTGTMDIPEHYH